MCSTDGVVPLSRVERKRMKRHLARIVMKRVFAPTSMGKSSPPCPLLCQGYRLAVAAAVEDYAPKHCYGIACRQTLSSAAMPHLAAMRFNVGYKREPGLSRTIRGEVQGRRRPSAATALHQTRKPQGRWKSKQPANDLSADKDVNETMSGRGLRLCISTTHMVSQCGRAQVVIMRNPAE
jgi:hypothetical protein